MTDEEILLKSNYFVSDDQADAVIGFMQAAREDERQRIIDGLPEIQHLANTGISVVLGEKPDHRVKVSDLLTLIENK